MSTTKVKTARGFGLAQKSQIAKSLSKYNNVHNKSDDITSICAHPCKQINRIPISVRNGFLQSLWHQMLVLRHTSRFIHKNHQKMWPGSKREQNTPILVQGATLSKWGPKIDPKSIKIKACTPRSPFLCSQVLLDRPMFTQDVKVEAAGMPNDMFWAPKL